MSEAYDDPEESVFEDADEPEEEVDPLRFLYQLAQHEGDLTEFLSTSELAHIGSRVVEDYNRDKASRKTWEEKVERALKAAAQEDGEEKTHPWPDASNVNYPILTEASLQFNARAYPAVVKGEEAVSVKVFGVGPPPVPQEAQEAAEHEPTSQEEAEQVLEAKKVILLAEERRKRHQAKLARAGRVKEFLNYTIFYKVDDWEADTDALLLQLPIVGCAFRKIWWDAVEKKHCSALVHALRLIVHMDAKSLTTTPRITEEVPDVYPYQIRERMRSGQYRTVELASSGDDDEAPRLLLEQQRFIDLDKDGVEEPYIVTVDQESSQVLSLQANFSPDDVKVDGDKVIGIRRGKFYVKYSFFPHPEGKFYDIGFGHLLDQVSAVINTAINQLNDAATAQVAGGGFISSGLRLQGAGQNANIRWRPGEYKTVSASNLSQAIHERTLPNPSPVTFQVLELMLGAAKDIAAIKDVITGETSKGNMPVGTTLALIEQGLQVFTAIYKRIYRALKEEFGLLYECVGKYADDETQDEYREILDDPTADLKADFDTKGVDIRPVSDPQSVTRMQKLAKSQMLLSLTGRGLNDNEIYRRSFEAADLEDVESLLPPPNPDASAEGMKVKSETAKNIATTKKTAAETVEIEERTLATYGRGVSGVEGAPGEPMGVPGGADIGPGPEGGMGPGGMGFGQA